MKNWLTIGIGVKRWLATLALGALLFGGGVVLLLIPMFGFSAPFPAGWQQLGAAVAICLGIILGIVSIVRLVRSVTAPFTQGDESLADAILYYRKRHQGPKIVAIGGGTGLSNLLRGLTQYTSNITAIVTVADDGGSSGRLRREFGMLPPGDFRNNIAALSRDEALMTQLLQYRFGGNKENQGLSGHAFGNLLIAALVGLTGSFEDALLATRRVLSIRGQVLPSTLTSVDLIADIEVEGKLKKVQGESNISHENGIIRKIEILPPSARGYPEAIRSILDADLIVLGPGSLFTSIIPNLLIQDIAKAVESGKGKVVYVCNVYSQPGETENYSVSDHVNKLYDYISADTIDYVLANNHAVEPMAEGEGHPILVDQLADVQLIQADLIDQNKPWRHNSEKLSLSLVQLLS